MTKPADIFFKPLNDKTQFKNKNIGLTKRAVDWKPTLYPLSKLPELIQMISQEKSHTTTIRYLVDLNKNLWFAKEGAPNKTIPAHYQMTGEKDDAAYCLAAGNIEFSADYKHIQMINHKSGDFRPDFESITWLLAILIANNTPLKEDLRVERLTQTGGLQDLYILSSAELKTWFSETFPIEMQQFTHQPQENKTVVYNKTSDAPPLIANDSVAKRRLSFKATLRDVRHSLFGRSSEPESSLLLEEEEEEEEEIATMAI